MRPLYDHQKLVLLLCYNLDGLVLALIEHTCCLAWLRDAAWWLVAWTKRIKCFLYGRVTSIRYRDVSL